MGAYLEKLGFKDIVFTESPQYISVGFITAGADIFSKSYKCDIYIWTGLKSAVPASPTYTLSQASTSANVLTAINSSYSVFEVSSFLQSYFNILYSDYSGLIEAVWFKCVIQASEEATTYDTGAKLATLGWGTYNEGGNPGLSISALNGTIVGLANNFNASTIESKIYPVYTGEGSTTVSLRLGSNSPVLVTSGSLDSAEQFTYYDSVDLVTGCGKEDLVVRTGVGISATYTGNFKNEKNQNLEVLYYGKSGVQCTLSMMGRVDERENRTAETYTNIDLDLTADWSSPTGRMSVYNAQKALKKTYSIQSNIFVKANSGLVSDEEVNSYRELFRSKYIWLKYNGQVYPSIITGNSLSINNEIYEQLNEFQIEFEIATPVINHVV